MTQASIGSVEGLSHPLPGTGAAREIIATAMLTQSLAVNISEVVSVRDGRRATLWLKHTAHASATDGIVVVHVMVSAEDSAPAIGDDS